MKNRDWRSDRKFPKNTGNFLKYEKFTEIRSSVTPKPQPAMRRVPESATYARLQLLNREEMEVLRSFVSSPIFNDVRPEETSSLFEYLRPHYPHFTAPEIDREVAARHFFPNATNPVGSLQRAMTQLMNVVRKFVAFRYTQLRDARSNSNDKVSLHDIQHKLALMRLYNERLHQNTQSQGADKQPAMPRETGYRKGRKAENFFLNLNKQVRDALDGQREVSGFDEYEFMDFMYFRFMTEHEKVLYETTSSLEEGDNNLLAATERLDSFYLTAKLEHICQLLHYGRRLALFEAGSPEFSRYEANVRFTIKLVGVIRETGLSVDPGLICIVLFWNSLLKMTRPSPISDWKHSSCCWSETRAYFLETELPHSVFFCAVSGRHDTGKPATGASWRSCTTASAASWNR
jgi:hypothetical protein